MIGNIGANPKITNLVLVDKTQEYSHSFNPKVKKLLVQARNFKDIRIAYKPGETETNYLSLTTGSPYWEDNIMGLITLSIKAESEDNVVVEILEWSATD